MNNDPSFRMPATDRSTKTSAARSQRGGPACGNVLAAAPPQQSPVNDDPFTLPPDLPIPHDDGGAAHLRGAALPDLTLNATVGPPVHLPSLDRAIVYFYPRTGVPGRSPGAAWDSIPGARGCTPQSCSFRDLAAEFAALRTSLYGLSTQTTEFQREFAQRAHIPFPILSDSSLDLTARLTLPTFEFDIEPLGGGGPRTLLRRMSWYVVGGVIRHVWYPVFPPDTNGAMTLAWLRANGGAA
jgi:peroxiredoxin